MKLSDFELWVGVFFSGKSWVSRGFGFRIFCGEHDMGRYSGLTITIYIYKPFSKTFFEKTG